MLKHVHPHHDDTFRVRMMDLAAAEEEERQEGRVKTNVFAYVMSCLVSTSVSIFTFTFIFGQDQCLRLRHVLPGIHLRFHFHFHFHLWSTPMSLLMPCLAWYICTSIFTFTFINCHLHLLFHYICFHFVLWSSWISFLSPPPHNSPRTK